MGILKFTNTWRAPLMLIDSWLPVPTRYSQPQTRTRSLMNRFVRAGWLNRAAHGAAVPEGALTRAASSEERVRSAHSVRVMRTIEDSRSAGARLVIAGRLADVCAELDRLAALEHRAEAY